MVKIRHLDHHQSVRDGSWWTDRQERSDCHLSSRSLTYEVISWSFDVTLMLYSIFSWVKFLPGIDKRNLKKSLYKSLNHFGSQVHETVWQTEKKSKFPALLTRPVSSEMDSSQFNLKKVKFHSWFLADQSSAAFEVLMCLHLADWWSELFILNLLSVDPFSFIISREVLFRPHWFLFMCGCMSRRYFIQNEIWLLHEKNKKLAASPSATGLPKHNDILYNKTRQHSCRIQYI